TGGINQDDLVFTLLVSLLFWFLGYSAAWHTFRIDRVWRVILPPGLILATNVVFYSGNADLDLYLVLFLFLSLLLIVRSNLDAREWEWYNNGVRVPRKLRRQFVNIGALLALIVLLVGWFIPSGDLQDRLDRFQQFLQSDPIQEMSEFWNRLVSPVEAQGPTTADYYGGDTLELGGAIRLGEQEVFYVDVPPDRRYYWRSRVYDTYEGGLWLPAADTRLTDNSAPFDVLVEPTAARELVQQEFIIALNATRILYTAPQPLQVDLPTRADLFYTAPETAQDRAMSISVIRPTRVVRRGERYTASSLMSVATADQLRQASTVYPDWISGLYQYVSPSVTQRTRDLARQVVSEAGAVNPYDQAKAIERYLRRTITYNETIPTPPANQDPVDWVLFDYQQGYCNYYASAMVVMLRSLGIPARMAAGFAQGTWDPVDQVFVVTERDAHTWVEAYFPGYGWIEFEPTAAQDPLNREGDDAPLSQQQFVPDPPTPTPSPSPTPAFTPTPPPTSTAEPSEPPPAGAAGAPPPTPTLTPSPTPTPTVTPMIIPTQPPSIPPETTNPLELLLPALGWLLLGIVLLIVIIALGIFIYWWWEWRGMGGLSPVARAYARLERYLGLIGLRLRPDETTEERRRRIIQVIPQAQRPINAITRLYTVERYNREEPNPSREQQKNETVDSAWVDARSNILRRWLRRFRFWSRSDD
ncbi:MAG: transglutaminase TgpA family protein, partial [Chloroflexota bacterium]